MISFYRSVGFVVLIVLMGSISAQNLVPNGSFEEFSECPDGLSQLQSSCTSWSSSRGSCDYYNTCSNPCDLSVPCNVFGWQHAVSGNGYAGFICTDVPELAIREHMIVELNENLIVNHKYYFSMYINNGIVLDQSPNKASNGQGAWLTTTEFSSLTNPSPIQNTSQVLNLEVVNDSTNWVQIKGSFIADSAYSYLVIGGFLDSANIEVVNVSGEGPFENNGEAYYFVDEVRLSTDSVYAFENLTTSLELNSYQEFTIYPNPFNDEFVIQSNRPFDNFRIYNSIGKVVEEQREHFSLSKRVSLARVTSRFVLP